MWWLFLACTAPPEPRPDTATTADAPAWTTSRAAPNHERIWGANGGGAPITDLGWVWFADGVVQRQDPLTGVHPLPAAVPAPLQAERAHTGELLVLGADGLVVLDAADRLVVSPLAEGLPGVPTAVRAAEGDLWLQADGLFRWANGERTELRIDGEAVTDDIAPGARVDGVLAVWVRVADGAVALAAADGRALARIDSWPESLAVDGSGRLWWTAGGALWRREANGDAERVPLSDDAWWVRANPHARGVWVQTATGLSHIRDDAITIASEGPGVDAPLPAGWSVDALGRLWARSADALDRLSVGWPVGIAGVLPGARVTAATEVAVLADDADAVGLSLVLCPGPGACTVTDDAERVDVALTDGRGVIDPDRIGTGSFMVEATASRGQDAVTAGFHLDLTASVPTWTTDIDPLFELRCAACHEAGSNATALDTRELWMTWWPEIEERVLFPETAVLEPMPFGDPDGIPQDERDLLAEWAAAGFP